MTRSGQGLTQPPDARQYSICACEPSIGIGERRKSLLMMLLNDTKKLPKPLQTAFLPGHLQCGLPVDRSLDIQSPQFMPKASNKKCKPSLSRRNLAACSLLLNLGQMDS
jgi:hypothetical protein